MAQRFELTILPRRGTNVKAHPSDETLYSVVDQRQIPNGIAMTVETSDVGGYNWDNNETIGEVRKSSGELLFSTEAFSTAGNMQGLELLYDGTNRNMVGVRNGKFYKIDSDRGVTNIDASSPVSFHTDMPITMVQYGAYIIIASLSLTPYKWMHGDANLTKLILAGGATEYKFRYMEQFKNCVIGAYSDQTNGSIDIRWSDPLTAFASFSFPSANQLYKPDNDIGITGIKRLGNVACLLYGDNSIYSMDYYPDYTPIFSLTEQVTGIGPRWGHSIVDTGRSHLFFDENKGFIEYAGGRQYEVVSEAIEPYLQTIQQAYYKLIVGANIHFTDEVAFSVPLDYATSNNAVFYYNTKTKQWRKENRACDVIGYKSVLTTFTWPDFISYNGVNNLTWPTDSRTWNQSIAGTGKVYYGKSDGYVYEVYGSDWNDGDYEAYRIEPILGSPDYTRYKRVQECHILGTRTGSWSVDVYWRGGDTEQEVISSTWEFLGSTTQETTSSQVIYFDKEKKYHQFRYGTDKMDEPFAVSRMILKGYMS